LDLKTVQHVGRLKDIVFVLLKYGFDDVVARLELPGKLLLKRVIHVERDLTTPQRIRRTLEELGPTFVKFGQVMSLRTDLLPAELILELKKLHDEVPPVAFDKIRQRIEKELGRPLEEAFVQFDPQPAAAASLAQVHRAVLRAERQAVAVKVQRPDIQADIESDLALMRLIARQLDQRMEALKLYDLPKLVQEFHKTVTRELDYSREARNMRIFRANFAGDTEVHVPHVFDPYSTRRMLVMEWIQGVKLSEAAPREPLLRKELARRGLRVTVKQILQDGFFHADPHPGNIIVRSDHTLCLLDCGMVGRLTDEMRFKLTDMIQAVVRKDSDRLVDVLLDLTRPFQRMRNEALQRDVLDLLDSYHSVPLSRLNLGQFLAQVTDVLREHGLRLPESLAVMIKALVTAEGVARELDPELNVVAEVQPMIARLVAEQWNPENLWRLIRGNLRHIWILQKHLPLRMSQIIEKLDRGELTVRFRHENLDPVVQTLEDIASRITVAVILGAIVIGSSLIITTGIGPYIFGFPALGVVGYLISVVLGFWIVFNIIQSQRW
jgi:ubiquinone biosynthesis protein